jgi:holin-like protein
MLTALLSLIGCQIIGELIRDAFHLPIPGPVLGMFLLAGVLAFHDRRRKPGADETRAALEQTAETLIAHMGLFFVPAGVGIIAEAGLLRQQWLPIVAAIFGSTLLSIVVTGLVVHWVTRSSEQQPSAAPAIPGQQGSRA